MLITHSRQALTIQIREIIKCKNLQTNIENVICENAKIGLKNTLFKPGFRSFFTSVPILWPGFNAACIADLFTHRSVFYSSNVKQNLMSTAATSALVAVFFGARMPFPFPDMKPASAAQPSAGSAQLLTLSASGKRRLRSVYLWMRSYHRNISKFLPV
jgi:hypothetical protein